MKDFTEVQKHNQKSWDLQVQMKNPWTIPVSREEIDNAIEGDIKLRLTPQKEIPSAWYEDWKNKNVLALASGGGQQGPLLAAFGAKVTVVDISKSQLKRDEEIAREHGLDLTCLQSSASNLNEIKSESIDFIINPTSNCFFEDIDSVWKECARVLKTDGEIIWGFINPMNYCFDFEKKNQGLLEVKYSQPYSDILSLSDKERKKFIGNENPLEFGHSLTDQITGLLKKGFSLIDLYEDYWGQEAVEDNYFPSFMAARARKIS